MNGTLPAIIKVKRVPIKIYDNFSNRIIGQPICIFFAVMQMKGGKGTNYKRTVHSPVPYNVRTHFNTTPEQEL